MYFFWRCFAPLYYRGYPGTVYLLSFDREARRGEKVPIVSGDSNCTVSVSVFVSFSRVEKPLKFRTLLFSSIHLLYFTKILSFRKREGQTLVRRITPRETNADRVICSTPLPKNKQTNKNV